MAKKQTVGKTTAEKYLETIVVGAGVSGLTAARRLQSAHPNLQILVLESEDRVLGSAKAGLTLISPAFARAQNLKTSQEFGAAKIRWERNWVAFDQVDWTSKEWRHVLPQWTALLNDSKVVFEDLPESNIEVSVKLSTPVNGIRRADDSASEWTIETPEGDYRARTVVWASGQTSFQNAYGKQESRDFQVANPLFEAQAREDQGVIALDLVLSAKPAFAENFDASSVFAIPCRYEGKFSLIIGVVFETKTASGSSQWVLRTLTHVHQDLLQAPKELSSFQKSIKRSLKLMLIEDAEFAINSEKIVVSPLGAGHMLGSPWAFQSGDQDGLIFVGDQGVSGAHARLLDLEASFESLKAIDGFQLIGAHDDAVNQAPDIAIQ